MTSPVTPEPPPPEQHPGTTDRRIVCVAGSGRSGTSLLSGILQHLGVHVPQPEVLADETNPRGFGEPQWVVDFHDKLLRRTQVQVSDARPAAWFATSRPSTFEPTRKELTAWLEGHFKVADELVIKDPRLAWFLSLWRVAAIRCDATPTFITMLRPPTEVVGSKEKYYGGDAGNIDRTAAWTNLMLHTERGTRQSPRVFIRYHDLLSDWTTSVFRAGEELDIYAVQSANAEQMRQVHQFIDPTLHRVRLTWDDVEVPDRLREITDETWQQLNKLAEPGGDTADVRGSLDELREAYADFYAGAEAITSSSIIAARRDGIQQVIRRLRAQGVDVPPPPAPGEATPLPAPAAAPSPAPKPRADATDRMVQRVPHWMRALVPGRVRRGVKRMLRRMRSSA